VHCSIPMPGACVLNLWFGRTNVLINSANQRQFASVWHLLCCIAFVCSPMFFVCTAITYAAQHLWTAVSGALPLRLVCRPGVT
jgi:hypothetical protein